MARSDWDWKTNSREPRDVANLHVCRALLRVFRRVRLERIDVDPDDLAMPLWPLLRLHPQHLRRSVANARPQPARGRRARAASPDTLAECNRELASMKELPAEPMVPVVSIVGQALVGGSPAFDDLFDAIEVTLESLLRRRTLPIDRKLALLSGLLHLSAHEAGFLRLCAAVELGSISTNIFSWILAPLRLVQALRFALEAPSDHAVRTMLRRTSPLMRSGLLEVDSLGSCRDLEDVLRLSRQAQLLFGSPATTAAQMAAIVLRRLPAAHETAIPPEWPHLAERSALIRRLLKNALAGGEPGINILLHGGPGTGKTEYAQRLVGEIGATGFLVADKDADGDAASRKERLQSLLLTQVFAPAKKSIVILDEAEDIFDTDYNNPFARAMGKKEESKSWMNGLLEGNPHPVIWISNRIDHLDPAYVRRFTYCLEFPQTPRRVRTQIARRYLEPVGCSEPLIQQVAAVATVSPALVASAARFATLARLGAPAADDGVRAVLTDLVAALGGEFRQSMPDRATRYDTRYLNVRGTATAEEVLRALERMQRGRVLLGGPPGTGKTQLAAEVAARLGRELVHRTASDINSMWFGQSERNVAKLFKDCDVAGEVLFLDEAETLLGSRDTASNRPEHAITAEFLRQVESFPGVFLCATNHPARLDAAMSRRFEFRLDFLPLLAQQRRELFAETALGWRPSLAPAEIDSMVAARLDRLDQLTPGDFANVVRRLAALGAQAEPLRVLQELEAEHAAKPDGGRRGIGFM